MPERPLLILPEPVSAVRQKRPGGPSKIKMPPPAEQSRKLAPKFARLQHVFESHSLDLREAPSGAEPEQVLVLETIGRIEDFYKAVREVEGLEWLVDWNEENIPPDEDFYWTGESPERGLPGRLYLIMSDQRGLQELLSLWELFRANPEQTKFRHGQTKWRDLFRQLKEVRTWGPEDRIRESGLMDLWQERVLMGQERIRLEIELWPRKEAEDRERASSIVTQLIQQTDGEVITQSFIGEIEYHGILAELPIQSVEAIVKNDRTRLVRCEQVMFFRPVGQAIVVMPEDEPVAGPNPQDSNEPKYVEPVVALLDGLPLENHTWLTGRLVIDDPDDWGSDYPAQDRHHGTAMASLILNGDLNKQGERLPRPIYTRPILKPDPREWRQPRVEYIPDDVLPVDLLHQVVRRMFEEIDGIPPVAPNVRIINLSIGDLGRPFYSYPSPLARLLDHLSWKYGVLFIVSSGNYTNEIVLNVQRTDLATLRTDGNALEAEILRAIEGESRLRRVLSPAESLNALTIAAAHEDCSSAEVIGNRINPYKSPNLPSPINTHGFGFRRALKPEVLFPGGRQVLIEKLGNTHTNATLLVSQAASAPGQLVAAPSPRRGALNGTRYMCGTSNATALATRAAAFLYETLNDLREEPGGDTLEDRYIHVLLKTLLVHGAAWGQVQKKIYDLLGKQDKNIVARLIGYGMTIPERVLGCTENRATLLGIGDLTDKEAHLYTVPLPSCINGQKVWRRVTVTLSWISPVNCKHNAYRKVGLWFTPYSGENKQGDFNSLLQVSRTEADWKAARRGTVQHEIFEGEAQSVFADDARLRIQINCRADAGKLGANIFVPYALAVSVEVADNVNLPVYEQIRNLVRPVVSIHPAAE